MMKMSYYVAAGVDLKRGVRADGKSWSPKYKGIIHNNNKTLEKFYRTCCV